MKNQVITVNRKKYAVGLFWQPLPNGQKARNFARSLARSVDKKLNLYTEYRTMVGLGSRKLGHKDGMQAAAAEVIDALSEYSSFLAVFELGTIFYLVAVRNGIVLEDKVFATANEARSEYASLFDIPDWNVVIAPSAWAMPRAVERKLPDLITGGARAVLRTISMFRGTLFSGLLIVAFVAVVVGWWHGQLGEMMSARPQVSKIDPELAAEYKRQIEEKNKELDAEFNIQKTVPPAPIVLPYNKLPISAERAQRCYQAIGFLMQSIPGWVQVSAECGEESASVQFKRSFGNINDFYAIATDLMPHSFVQEKNEDNVVVTAFLPTVGVVSSQDERDAETVVRDINARFQEMNENVEVYNKVDTITNGVDVVNLNTIEVAASSKLVPPQFMEIFNDFGGVYMTRCIWDAAKRTWNYEVIIYAK